MASELVDIDAIGTVQGGEFVPASSVVKVLGGVAVDADLTQVMAKVPGSDPPPTPGARTMIVASQYNGPTTDIKVMEAQMGLDFSKGEKLDMHRCYESGGPTATWGASKAAPDIAEGRGFWISFKGDIQGWLAGNYDTNMKKLCNTVNPNWPNMHFSVWHEPEPKFKNGALTPEEWVDLQVYFYELCRPLLPPNVRIAPIHGGFAWKPGDSSTANPARWLVPLDKRDFVGLDLYGHTDTGDIDKHFPKDPEPILTRFQREIVKGQDLCLAETGTRLRTQQGIDWIEKHLADCLAKHPNIIGFSYWNSDTTVDPGPTPDYMCQALGRVWRKYSKQSVGVIN